MEIAQATVAMLRALRLTLLCTVVLTIDGCSFACPSSRK